MAAYKERTTWIAKVLTDLREEKGYSQADVSTVIGITRSAYTYYELSRSKPPITALASLSKFYHVQVNVFFDL